MYWNNVTIIIQSLIQQMIQQRKQIMIQQMNQLMIQLMNQQQNQYINQLKPKLIYFKYGLNMIKCHAFIGSIIKI